MMTQRSVGMLGVCSDANSSHFRGPAEAPDAIRKVLQSGASNLTSEQGTDLHDSQFHDLGNLAVDDTEASFLGIEAAVRGVIESGYHPLILGGDHAITYPVMRAIHRSAGAVEILHFDAHSDLYDVFEGNRYSHACPFARIMEERLASRLVQVGIRTQTTHLRAQAERFGVEVYEMSRFDPATFVPDLGSRVYLSFDMDALDPAFAPGVSHHEPGGLTVREVLRMIHSLKVPVVGADIVEFNPRRDVMDMTAAVAAKLVKEFSDLLLRSNRLPEAYRSSPTR